MKMDKDIKWQFDAGFFGYLQGVIEIGMGNAIIQIKMII